MNKFYEQYPNLGTLINKEAKRYQYIKEFIEKKRPKLQKSDYVNELISLDKGKILSFDPKQSTYNFKKYIVDKNVNLYVVDIKFNNINNKVYKAVILTPVNIKKKDILLPIDEKSLEYHCQIFEKSAVHFADYFIVNIFGRVPHIEYIETDISHYPLKDQNIGLQTTAEYFASGISPWVTLWLNNPICCIHSLDYFMDWRKIEKAVKETFRSSDDAIKLIELTDGSQCYNELEELVKPFQYTKKKERKL